MILQKILQKILHRGTEDFSGTRGLVDILPLVLIVTYARMRAFMVTELGFVSVFFFYGGLQKGTEIFRP